MESVLRLIHIGSAVFWAGGSFATVFYVGPTASEVGEAAGPFMGGFLRSKYSEAMVWASSLAVVAGIALWAVKFGSKTPSGFAGVALVIGAISGIVALGLGHGQQRPAVKAIRKLAGEMAGGAPTEEQRTQMAALQARLMKAGNLTAWALIVALAGMALGG